MSQQIINLPEIKIIGMELRTGRETAAQEIPAHWQKVCTENCLEKVPNKIDQEILGLYTNYEGDYTQPYSLIICCRVSSLDNVPAGMVSKIIPSAKYALFTAQGKFPDCVIQTWQTIWNTPINRSYTSDFEVYGKNSTDPENAEVGIYIAVK